MSRGNDLLMQGGLPPVRLKNKNDRFDGVLISIDDVYQSLNEHKEPDWWDEAKTRPKEVIPIVLRNDLDNKMYCLHVGVSSDLQKAIAKGVREAGGESAEPGGHLSVVLIDLEPQTGIKNDKKIHAAAWSLPPSRSSSALMGAQDAAPAVPAQPAVNPAAVPPVAAQPVAQPVAQPEPAAPAATVGGVDVSGLDPATRAAVEAVLRAQAGTPSV